MSRMIMIDLETLDTLPTAMIVSIGAVSFDPDSPSGDKTYSAKIDLKTAIGTIGPDTVIWWMQQNIAARDALTKPGIALIEAMSNLQTFCADHDSIWAGPSYFDITILENTYRALNLSVPWPFWKVRDWTTFRRLFNVEKVPAVVEHDALSDAQAQVVGFRKAWTKLRTCTG